MVQITALAFALLSFAIPQDFHDLSNNINPQQNEEEIANWVGKHAQAAMDLLLPFGSDNKLGDEDEWRMIARILPAWEPACRLQVKHRWDGKIEATLDQVDKRSIGAWLEYLHVRKPNADLKEIIRFIIVRKIKIDSKQCPQLKPLIEVLYQMKIPVIPSAELALDRTGYQIMFEAPMSSKSLNLTLNDLDNHPLRHWLTEFVSFIKTNCHQEINKE